MSLEFASPDTALNYIVDDIGTVVARVRANWLTADNTDITADNSNITVDGNGAPYYMYGHKLEVAQRIFKKNQSFKKFPLVFLVMDFPEEKHDGILTCTLNIGLIHKSKEDYNAEQRYTNVFKTVLYPLYTKFLQELDASGLFTWDKENQLVPEHTKIDRPFWGTEGKMKNDKYIFDDPIDCIEIVGLKLNQSIKKV